MNDDELDPDARQLVDLARGARSPSDEQRERAYQVLMAGLGGGAGVGVAKITAAKIAGKSSVVWLKWALPALLVASAGVGSYVWSRRPAPVVHVPVKLAPSQVVPVTARPVAVPSADASTPLAPSAELSPSTAPVVRTPAVAKPSADDLVQELSLLHQALAESRSGHAARALELARQHAQRYPNSRLRIERDAIEVRSLCALGRSGEAHKIADRLRSQAPNSPVSAALQETCVGK